jgi:hypothetical protein
MHEQPLNKQRSGDADRQADDQAKPEQRIKIYAHAGPLARIGYLHKLCGSVFLQPLFRSQVAKGLGFPQQVLFFVSNHYSE